MWNQTGKKPVSWVCGKTFYSDCMFQLFCSTDVELKIIKPITKISLFYILFKFFIFLF